MRRALPVRQADELLRVNGPGPGKPNRGGRWLALPAAAVLCCAGPALLTAVGAGSVGALVGGATGSVVLAFAGLILLLATAAVTVRRRRRTRR